MVDMVNQTCLRLHNKCTLGNLDVLWIVTATEVPEVVLTKPISHTATEQKESSVSVLLQQWSPALYSLKVYLPGDFSRKVYHQILESGCGSCVHSATRALDWHRCQV